jgi:preprotein translocase subunit SecE
VSDSAVTDAGDKAPRHESGEGLNVFQRIALFVRQVIAELRLVVTPTREEWLRYIWIVLVFVAVMMALVSLMDLAFGWLTSVVFGE